MPAGRWRIACYLSIARSCPLAAPAQPATVDAPTERPSPSMSRQWHQRVLSACGLFAMGAAFGATLSSRGPFTLAEIRTLLLCSVVALIFARPLIGERPRRPLDPKHWHPNLRG